MLFSLNNVFFLLLLSGGGYSGNQDNRYVGFGNTVTPEKKEDDFLNSAMTSIYSVGHNTSTSPEVPSLYSTLRW